MTSGGERRRGVPEQVGGGAGPAGGRHLPDGLDGERVSVDEGVAEEPHESDREHPGGEQETRPDDGGVPRGEALERPEDGADGHRGERFDLAWPHTST